MKVVIVESQFNFIRRYEILDNVVIYDIEALQEDNNQ
jgi:hypothetical protein